jgi:DNA-binding CsgD family transcriptional regulator
MTADDFLTEVSIIGAFLDEKGVITGVTNGWREVAEDCSLGLGLYGIGENYLKHCVFPDPTSVEIVRGLKKVLTRKVDLFGTVYPCPTPEHDRWFLLLAFALHRSDVAVAILHLDLSRPFAGVAELSAALTGFGKGASEVIEDGIRSIVRRSIAEAIADHSYGSGRRNGSDPVDKKKIASLTQRQMTILGHLSQGASNSEIAAACSLSLNAVKAQSAIIVRKLGVRNRTQAALFAARNGLDLPPAG